MHRDGLAGGSLERAQAVGTPQDDEVIAGMHRCFRRRVELHPPVGALDPDDDNTEPPEDGKANAALESLLARALRLPKSAVRVTGGGKSRNKTVTIDGDSETIMSQLTHLLSGAKSHG